MMYLITYDISQDRARNKIAKLLIAEGYERIQYSVFAGTANPSANPVLWNKIIKLESDTKQGEYRLYVIPVPDRNFLAMEIVGDMGFEMDYLTGKKSTLFI